MRLVVLADEILMEELLSNGKTGGMEIIWIHSPEEFHQHEQSDAYVDLLFDGSPSRIELLQKFSGLVIVSSVEQTLKEMQAGFIRINGWPTFLNRQVIEASGGNEIEKQQVEKIFSAMNKKMEWLPDEPGFISARVVAMIINEAWFALSEGVSTKNEIDIAMKLGTNYPYGPFEWCEKIGRKKIYSLLTHLGEIGERYIPSELLKEETVS